MIAFFDFIVKPISITYGIFLYLLLASFIPVRDHLIWKVLAIIGCWQTSLMVIFPNDPFNLIALFGMLFATLLITFKGKLIETVSAVLILSSIIIAINYMTHEMGRMFFLALGNTSQVYESATLVLVQAIRVPIWAAIYLFFRKRLRQAFQILTVRMWLIVDAVSLGSLVGVISVLNLIPDGPSLWPSYPACAACLLTELGCIYLISYISASMRAQMEISNLRYQQAYYQELEQNQRETRKLRHDMNNHFSVIRSLLEKKKWEQALTYVSDLSQKLPAKTRTFCKNSVMNAVFNAKYDLAVQNQIDCFFKIDLDRMPELDPIDLCSIFANTLDNAIEASCALRDPKERSISVKARYDKEYFSYKIINAKENPVRQLDNRFVSTKGDSKFRGFGLENVKDVVNRLGGTMDVSHTEDTFSVVILIHIPSTLFNI